MEQVAVPGVNINGIGAVAFLVLVKLLWVGVILKSLGGEIETKKSKIGEEPEAAIAPFLATINGFVLCVGDFWPFFIQKCLPLVGLENSRFRVETAEVPVVAGEPELVFSINENVPNQRIRQRAIASPRVFPDLESLGSGVVTVQAVGSGNPNVPLAVLLDVIDVFVADGALRLPGVGQVLPESVAVIAVEAVSGADPEVALLVPQDALHVVIGEALFFGEMGKIVERLRLGSENEKQQKGQQAHHRFFYKTSSF